MRRRSGRKEHDDRIGDGVLAVHMANARGKAWLVVPLLINCAAGEFPVGLSTISVGVVLLDQIRADRAVERFCEGGERHMEGGHCAQLSEDGAAAGGHFEAEHGIECALEIAVLLVGASRSLHFQVYLLDGGRVGKALDALMNAKRGGAMAMRVSLQRAAFALIAAKLCPSGGILLLFRAQFCPVAGKYPNVSPIWNV